MQLDLSDSINATQVLLQHLQGGHLHCIQQNNMAPDLFKNSSLHMG